MKLETGSCQTQLIDARGGELLKNLAVEELKKQQRRDAAKDDARHVSNDELKAAEEDPLDRVYDVELDDMDSNQISEVWHWR